MQEFTSKYIMIIKMYPKLKYILNVHFSTIGAKLAMTLKSFITLPSPPARSTDLPKFVFKPITEAFVRGQLKQLRTNKAIGLDNMSVRLLKDSASVISKSLAKLFKLFYFIYYFLFFIFLFLTL